jgi:hypothetical protein
MTDIALVTANKVEIVESGLQLTLPAAEAVTAGQAVRIDVSTGKFTKSNSTSAAEARVYGFASKTVAAGEPLTAIRNGVMDGFDLSGLDYDDPLYLSNTDGAISDSDVSANEQQTVTLNNTPTGGTFTLTFNGQTTATIAYNASAATVKTRLEALSTIGSDNVNVTGSAGGPYTVEFVGALADENVAAMTANGASLTGAGAQPTVTIATAQAGIELREIGRVIPGTGTTLGTAYDKLLLVDL